MLFRSDDRYKVTGFGTLFFYDQEEFRLDNVQIEMREPKKIYWFKWKEGTTEPLLDKLMELADSAYRPCCLKDGEVIYNIGSKICHCYPESMSDRIVIIVGTQLKIKED